MTDMLLWTKPANGWWISWEAAMLPEEAREAAKVGEKPENVEAEGKMIFLGGDPSPCHFLTYVLQESDIFNGLLVGCGFGVPLHPFTNIHFSLACWDRHALKVNLLYFHAHWIVYFMYLYLHTQYSFCSQKYRFFPQAFGWKYDII